MDDLEFENNSVGNDIREAILNLPDLDDEECSELLDTLNESALADQRPVAAVIGLAADAGSFWSNLRVGELKTLLDLAIGDEAATLEGCDWIKHFDQLNPQRRAVYACIESLINLADMGGTGPYLDALRQLYGAGAVTQAHALIMQTDRFMGLSAPGLMLAGCEMHHKLLAAYDKVHGARCLRGAGSVSVVIPTLRKILRRIFYPLIAGLLLALYLSVWHSPTWSAVP